MTTISVQGTGAVTRKTVNAVLKDYLSTADGVSFVLPATSEDVFSDAVRYVADFVLDAGVPATLITEDGTLTEGLLDDYEADHITVVGRDGDIPAFDRLFLAWDDSVASEHEALAEEVIQGGGLVFDLTDALFPIELDEDDDSEPESTPEPEPEPKVVETKKPAAKKPAARTKKEPAPEPPVDEFYAPGANTSGHEVASAAPPSGLSDTDVTKIAEAVVALLASRLK